jgi:hypothetical protein
MGRPYQTIPLHCALLTLGVMGCPSVGSERGGEDTATPGDSEPDSDTASVAPDIEVEPLEVDLGGGAEGQVLLGSFMVRNAGTATLTATVVLEGDNGFGVDAPEGATLAPGEEWAQGVSFVSDVAGEHTASVEVRSNDPDEPTVTVALRAAVGNDNDGDGYVEGRDCDDDDPSVNPGATEVWYDGVDQDCDGNDDDQDGDGYAFGADCDDTDASVNPAAPETWYDGIDQDCDGRSDFDQDGDGYEAISAGGADCDDTDPSASPGSLEDASDGVDNDCDGEIDEAMSTVDADGDGYSEVDGDCNDGDATISPGQAETWYDGLDQDCSGGSDFDQDGDGAEADAWGGTDCADTDPAVNPSATETWYDGVDQDCDGNDDDQDGDGYAFGADCDDTDASRHPGTAEVWYDGVDQDCDGNDDDQDGDGYGLGADCDDTDASLSPGAAETWYDGVDQDCDGNDDDQDGDGYANADDCDDTDGAMYPGSAAACDGRTCGWDFCGGQCGGVACATGSTSNTVLQVVGNWYISGTSDAMLSEDPSESPSGGSFEGQLFYAADDTSGGDTPLYRLYQASPGNDADDHMASTSSSEGSPAFSLEGELAVGWAAEQPGTDLLCRYLSSSPYDHDAAFTSDPPSGYAAEGGLLWVYPRYGLDDEVLTTISGSEVDLGVNLVGGGAVWSLEWNGLEFLSAYDFGRQLQIAFQANNAGEDDNPTEAGDGHSSPSDAEGWRHGSPLLDITTGSGTVHTTTRPLQWHPEAFHTGAHDTTRNPVAWDGTFEKEITLDYGGNPHVIAWTTRIGLPQEQGALNIELATAYLTGRFNTFYTYDVAAGALTDKTSGIPLGGCVDPSDDPDQQPEAGGVIISTAAGDYAMGVYRNRGLNATEGYGLCSFLYGDTDPYDFSTSKWNLLERPTGGLDAGTFDWSFFIVVGTLADCVGAMDDLYAAGE